MESMLDQVKLLSLRRWLCFSRYPVLGFPRTTAQEIRIRSHGISSAMQIRATGGMTMIGVLAYGSLITDPGSELAAITVAVTKDVMTPFAVEFARTSRRRGGAPTLVPVDVGGCPVRAVIFKVEGDASEVADIVYRREIHAVGSGKRYSEPPADRTDAVRIARLEDLAGFDLVLSTQIATNIDPISAEFLADLAIASAQALDDGRDGISYLIAARKSGIETPLTSQYAACILTKTGADDLASALRAVQEERWRMATV